VSNPVTRAVGRLLTNLIFLKVSIEKTLGRGAGGRAGLHATVSTCFSLLFGAMQLDSDYRLYLGLPPALSGKPGAPAAPPHARPQLPPPADPLAPPTPLRAFTPTAAADPDTEEVHLLCSTELKDSIMRFLYTQSHATGGRFLLLNSSSYAAAAAEASSSSTPRLAAQSTLASSTASFLQQRHASLPAAAAGAGAGAVEGAGAQPPDRPPSRALLFTDAPGGGAGLGPSAAAGAAAAAFALQVHLRGPERSASPEQRSPAARHPLCRRGSRTSIEEEQPATPTAAAASAASAASAAGPAAPPAPGPLLYAPAALAAAGIAAPSAAALASPAGACKAPGRPPLPYATSARRMLQQSSDPGAGPASGALAGAASPSAAAALRGLKGLLSEDSEAVAAAATAAAGGGGIPWMSPKRSPGRPAAQEAAAQCCEAAARGSSCDGVV
jgi:hypothetical protein